MISNNGYTWTDKEETLDIHEQLVAAGWTGFEPSCQRLVRKAQGAKHEPCGKTTAFAVITRAELGSKTRMGKMAFFALGNANNLATLEGLYYYPFQTCVPCEAAESGYEAGRSYDEDMYGRSLAGIAKGPISADDITLWSKVFKLAFEKGRGYRLAQESKAAEKKDVSRYRPKAGRGV